MAEPAILTALKRTLTPEKLLAIFEKMAEDAAAGDCRARADLLKLIKMRRGELWGALDASSAERFAQTELESDIGYARRLAQLAADGRIHPADAVAAYEAIRTRAGLQATQDLKEIRRVLDERNPASADGRLLAKTCW